MRVVLYSNKDKQTLELPVNIEGSFLLTDDNQNQICSINSEENNWVMSVNSNMNIIENGVPTSKKILSTDSIY